VKRTKVERREEEGMSGAEDGKCRANEEARKNCLAAVEQIRGPSFVDFTHGHGWKSASQRKRPRRKSTTPRPPPFLPKKVVSPFTHLRSANG